MEQILKDKIIYRKAVKEDAEKLNTYLDMVGKESDNLTYRDWTLTTEEQEDFIRRYNEKENCLRLIAVYDGEIVGNIDFRYEIGGQKLIHNGELGISVAKEYWGQGIGTELMKLLIDWIKTIPQYKRLELKVRADNGRAINLYTKFGFRVEGSLIGKWFDDGKYYDMYQMVLFL